MPPIYRPARLLIADDHELIRDGFRAMLEKQPHIDLVGLAENGQELLDLARSLQPTVIITDIVMPVLTGIEATRLLAKELPSIAIIAYTMFEEEVALIDMLEAGARGYLTKSSGKEEILEAIQAVLEGKMYYCHATTMHIAELIARSKFNPYKQKPEVEFSKRELEIIRLICQEKSSKQIADLLNLSTRTVEGHRDRILKKMSVSNTAGIVVFAMRKGLYKSL